MPPRPKKIKPKLLAKKKTKNTIRQSPPTLQPQQPPLQDKELRSCQTASATCQNHSAGDQYSEKEERQKVSANLNEMADSSNGKLEGDENVQPGDVGDSKPVVESVRDVTIDAGSEPAKETREDDADGSSSSSSSCSSDEEAESAQVVDHSGEVVEEKTEEVDVSVVETVESVSNHLDQGGVVEETKAEEVVEEEKVVTSLDETDESSPAITEEVSKQVEEKTLSYVEESNGVSSVETGSVSDEVEESTLPLSKKDDCAPVITYVESKGTEEADVESKPVPAAVADVVSKGTEEIKLPVSEEQTRESSGTAYKEEVRVVESADAGQDYGKAVNPESTGNPQYTVSVAGRPLHPTSWMSCCGLFEILHRRSDR
ncbi:probable GPI-anchored adhesin-like protein PGA55 isoform X1 [Pyrus communis]|uniref:probable GPI-anchored adhesin-like protein PGA55 isoform X1 n=2 Tax=Pyrus communis TaxID=23211 RepID=UPI0035BED000